MIDNETLVKYDYTRIVLCTPASVIVIAHSTYYTVPNYTTTLVPHGSYAITQFSISAIIRTGPPVLVYLVRTFRTRVESSWRH